MSCFFDLAAELLQGSVTAQQAASPLPELKELCLCLPAQPGAPGAVCLCPSARDAAPAYSDSLYVLCDASNPLPLPGGVANILCTSLSFDRAHSLFEAFLRQNAVWDAQLLLYSRNGIKGILQWCQECVGFSAAVFDAQGHLTELSELFGLGKREAAEKWAVLCEAAQKSNACFACSAEAAHTYFAFLPDDDTAAYPVFLLEAPADTSRCTLWAAALRVAAAFSQLSAFRDRLPAPPDYQVLIERALCTKAAQTSTFQERFLKAFGPNHYFFSILIDFFPHTPAPSLDFLKSAYRKILPLFPRDHGAILDGQLCLLCVSDDLCTAPTFDTERLQAILDSLNGYAVLSRTARHIENLHIMYQEARQTLSLAARIRLDDSGRRIFRFDEYSTYFRIHLMAASMENMLGTSDLYFQLHPGVLALTRYDQQFQSDLRKVLFTYLQNNCNIAVTSRQLFLHRNTLLYKINRIEEIIERSLRDPNLQQELLFSCRMVQYREDYQEKKLFFAPSATR